MNPTRTSARRAARHRLATRLPTAATLLFSAGLAAAQSDSLQLYGNVGAGIIYKNHQTGGGHSLQMTNSLLSSSYFGFRGQEDLGGGLRAVFRLESGFNTDSGNPNTASKFFNRQSFVGLAHERLVTVTLGRQFHASTDRVIQSLDAHSVAGPVLDTAPIGLFGVNRFAGNDNRVDDSLKVRLNGPVGSTLGLSYGNGEGAGKSVAFDLAQVTPDYTVALYGVKYNAPAPVANTNVFPEHQVIGGGAQVPVGPVRLYLNLFSSTLDSTAANRPVQKNKGAVAGIRYGIANYVLKAAYTHDKGTAMNNVAGRDGTKDTWLLSAEYYFSKRTSAYVAAFSNRFSGGYRLDPLNIAALSRDPNAAATRGYSVGMRHEF